MFSGDLRTEARDRLAAVHAGVLPDGRSVPVAADRGFLQDDVLAAGLSDACQGAHETVHRDGGGLRLPDVGNQLCAGPEDWCGWVEHRIYDKLYHLFHRDGDSFLGYSVLPETSLIQYNGQAKINRVAEVS